MKQREEATEAEIGNDIIFTLADARKRPYSDNFLDGFPWKRVRWYKEDLEGHDLENLLDCCDLPLLTFV